MIAEVIASNTRSFKAELAKTQEVPALGTWLQCSSNEGQWIFGVVSLVEQGSVEPNRQPVALGRTRDELQKEFPHISELLRTVITVQVLAYTGPEGMIVQGLPAQPARLHDFVHLCERETLIKLGAPYDFLRILIGYAEPSTPVDDMLVNILKQLQTCHAQSSEGYKHVVQAGRALGRLLRDDHERLQSILRRVSN